MSYYEKKSMRFDTAAYDHEIVFDELLNGVLAKYTAIITPKGPQLTIILRIQCAIEIVSNTLDQIEHLIKETFKISFTLSTIRSAISTINKELIVVFQEVKDFFKSLQTIEITNKRAFDMVALLSKEIKNFEKYHYLIPEIEKTLLKENIEKEIPLLKQYLMSEITDEDDTLIKEMTSNALFGTSVMQILKLNDTFQFFNRLRSLHCEFSFLLLSIYFRDNCPTKDRLDTSNKTKIPNAHLEDLFNRCVELGQMVFEKVNVCRRNYCQIYQKRKELIDNYRKKQEMQIKQLNNLQVILRIISELNEKHDTLVGKLIKTSELYAEVHNILEQSWKVLKVDAGVWPNPNEPATQVPSKSNTKELPSVVTLNSELQ